MCFASSLSLSCAVSVDTLFAALQDTQSWSPQNSVSVGQSPHFDKTYAVHFALYFAKTCMLPQEANLNTSHLKTKIVTQQINFSSRPSFKSALWCSVLDSSHILFIVAFVRIYRMFTLVIILQKTFS